MRLPRVRGVPGAGEAVRFIESVRRQLVCSYVATPDGALSILAGHS